MPLSICAMTAVCAGPFGPVKLRLDLSLKLVADCAAIDWEQVNPNALRFSKTDEPTQINCTVPSIADGLVDMSFIQACKSAMKTMSAGRRWRREIF